ncbi:pentapeptide repeat-containing protein [Glycomyces harbinensis]|uniref:Pentapeptide repeat-containing protein n=1 Tax=Glycomyces harbinensis TaxID=58114 RepID=A0A1G6Y8D5_9ACTN|nr:pentapeptide repeat-containing protein [Glycomyces harbinensis]SDD86253.1 Pentapeptide repeat-containing protein [Glycomyces harbinensis]
MKFRKIDERRSMRRPLWEAERLQPLEEPPDPDFELSERLLDGLQWTSAQADGSLDQSLVRSTDLSGTVLTPFEIVDTTIERSVLSNSRWERATARRLEITDSNLVGWQTQFSLAQDVYIADCRADFAGISIGSAKGPVVFERCRFMNATFLGDFSKTVFIECTFPGADFSRVANAKGCDFRQAELGGITGLMSLRGSLITADQAVEIAGELAKAAGFKLA